MATTRRISNDGEGEGGGGEGDNVLPLRDRLDEAVDVLADVVGQVGGVDQVRYIEVYRLVGTQQSRHFLCSLTPEVEDEGMLGFSQTVGPGKFAIRARGTARGRCSGFKNVPEIPGEPWPEPRRTRFYAGGPADREPAVPRDQDPRLVEKDSASAAAADPLRQAFDLVEARSPETAQAFLAVLQGKEPPPAARPSAAGSQLAQLLERQDRRMERLEQLVTQRPAGGLDGELLKALLPRLLEPPKGTSDAVLEKLIEKSLGPSAAWTAVQALGLAAIPALGGLAVTYLETKAEAAGATAIGNALGDFAEGVTDILAEWWPEKFGREEEDEGKAPADGQAPPAQLEGQG